jgi:hypothetical protein
MASGKGVSNMDKERFNGLTALTMRATGTTGMLSVQVSFKILKETSSKAISIIIKRMVLVITQIITVYFTLDSGKMTNSMVMVLRRGKKARNTKAVTFVE